jgi:Ca2+-transporting ATPase
VGIERWSGLTSGEAARRLAEDGPNVLATSERRSVAQLAASVVREPMFVLLLIAGALYLAFGDVREALTLLGFVIIVMTITVLQEGRTERALDALRDLSSPRAQVLRDGAIVTLPARELVRGDVIRVAEGDRVPADAALREGTALSIDESLLTGESVPVAKLDGDAPLYAGTVIVAGRGVAEVVATGARSQLGRIGASLQHVERIETPLQREVGSLVRRFAIVGGGLSIALAVVRAALDAGWREAMLSGITLAMSLLPEELPVIMTVFLAIGAWRIAKLGVLTRRVSSVETLGAADVLCSDKTGTLTRNRMTIARLVTADADVPVADDDGGDLPEDVHALVEAGVLASPRDPFDPMEQAFWALARRTLSGTEHLHPSWEPVREYPLRPGLLAVTRAWRSAGGAGLAVATKGAPEAVFDLCHLSEEAAAPWRARVEALAREGLRVLAIARSPDLPSVAPSDPHVLPYELLGLVALADPLRADVPGAIARCRSAGIRVVMITGDHPDTARAIARQAGIDATELVTGADIDELDDDALADRLARASVVARAVPAHKLRIIRALQRRELVVGMTGDGVNDAPALRAADIGIAMGARGTDVAREAAALVLVDDDFASIVDAVRTGRRVYDNMRAAIGYTIAVHLPIAGFALLPPLVGWPALLGPAHVLFLELIIDPTCSVVFEVEPEDERIMERPPRSRRARLLDPRAAAWAVVQGAAVLAAALAVAGWAIHAGLSDAAARTAGFVALVVGNLTTVIASRSTRAPFWRTLRRRNRALPWLLGTALALLAVVVSVPPVRGLFAFAGLPAGLLAAAVLASAVPLLALDVAKLRATLPRASPAPPRSPRPARRGAGGGAAGAGGRARARRGARARRRCGC